MAAPLRQIGPRRSSGHPWRRAGTLFAVAFVLFAGAVLGCSHSDTVVQIEVRGDIQGVEQLRATLSIAGQTRVLMVPAQPQVIMLPTSFTVQINPSLRGPLDVALDALDGSGNVIGHGALSMADVNVGKANQIEVDLTPGAGPGPDGGAPDAGVDAGSDVAMDGAPDDRPAMSDAASETTGSGGVGGGSGGGTGGGAGGVGGVGGGSGAGGGGVVGTGGAGDGGSGGGGGGADGGGGAAGGGAGGGNGGDDGGVDAPDPDA